MGNPNAGRRTRRYLTLKAIFRAECEADESVCHICCQPIDYGLAYPHPESWSLDHYHSIKNRPELAEDPANFRPSHLVCNDRKGADGQAGGLGNMSRKW